MTTDKLPQRKDYMDGHISFEDFYRSVYKIAGINLAGNRILDRVRTALSAGDEHLNSIPLPVWDALAHGARLALATSFKKHGDFFSLAGGVCAMKQAARDAVEE